MAVAVEKISNLERRMTIKVPLAPLEAQVGARLKEIARTAKLSGFRPGKAPIGLINQQYGSEARDEVYSKAVEMSFGEAAEENKLRVAGFPNIEHKPFEEASTELEYTATFEVMPEIDLGDLSKVKVEKPTLKITDADVKKTIDVLVQQRVTYEPVKRASKKADRVNISLKATMDGDIVENTNEKGVDLVIGAQGHIEQFDKELTGGKPGDSRTFTIKYPDDHNPAQMAGRTIKYDVTFNTVSQPVLPEVDAEFAKSLGVDDGNVGTMKAEVKQSLEQEVEKRVKARLKDSVFQALIDSTEVDLPKVMIGSEINRIMEQTAKNLEQRGMDPKTMNLEPSMFEDQAKRNATLRLILSDVVTKNELQAKPDQIRSLVELFAQSYEKPEELINWYYADVKRLDEPASLAAEENVVAWVLEKAKVTEKKIKFDELMADQLQS